MFSLSCDVLISSDFGQQSQQWNIFQNSRIYMGVPEKQFSYICDASVVLLKRKLQKKRFQAHKGNFIGQER